MSSLPLTLKSPSMTFSVVVQKEKGSLTLGFSLKKPNRMEKIYVIESVTPEINVISTSTEGLSVMPLDEVVGVSLYHPMKDEFVTVKVSQFMEMTVPTGMKVKLELQRRNGNDSPEKASIDSSTHSYSSTSSSHNTPPSKAPIASTLTTAIESEKGSPSSLPCDASPEGLSPSTDSKFVSTEDVSPKVDPVPPPPLPPPPQPSRSTLSAPMTLAFAASSPGEHSPTLEALLLEARKQLSDAKGEVGRLTRELRHSVPRTLYQECQAECQKLKLELEDMEEKILNEDRLLEKLTTATERNIELESKLSESAVTHETEIRELKSQLQSAHKQTRSLEVEVAKLKEESSASSTVLKAEIKRQVEAQVEGRVQELNMLLDIQQTEIVGLMRDLKESVKRSQFEGLKKDYDIVHKQLEDLQRRRPAPSVVSETETKSRGDAFALELKIVELNAIIDVQQSEILQLLSKLKHTVSQEQYDLLQVELDECNQKLLQYIENENIIPCDSNPDKRMMMYGKGLKSSAALQSELLRLKQELQNTVPATQYLEAEQKAGEFKRQLEAVTLKLRESDIVMQKYVTQLKSKNFMTLQHQITELEQNLKKAHLQLEESVPKTTYKELEEKHRDLATKISLMETSRDHTLVELTTINAQKIELEYEVEALKVKLRTATEELAELKDTKLNRLIERNQQLELQLSTANQEIIILNKEFASTKNEVTTTKLELQAKSCRVDELSQENEYLRNLTRQLEASESELKLMKSAVAEMVGISIYMELKEKCENLETQLLQASQRQVDTDELVVHYKELNKSQEATLNLKIEELKRQLETQNKQVALLEEVSQIQQQREGEKLTQMINLEEQIKCKSQEYDELSKQIEEYKQQIIDFENIVCDHREYNAELTDLVTALRRKELELENTLVDTNKQLSDLFAAVTARGQVIEELERQLFLANQKLEMEIREKKIQSTSTSTSTETSQSSMKSSDSHSPLIFSTSDHLNPRNIPAHAHKSPDFPSVSGGLSTTSSRSLKTTTLINDNFRSALPTSASTTTTNDLPKDSSLPGLVLPGERSAPSLKPPSTPVGTSQELSTSRVAEGTSRDGHSAVRGSSTLPSLPHRDASVTRSSTLGEGTLSTVPSVTGPSSPTKAMTTTTATTTATATAKVSGDPVLEGVDRSKGDVRPPVRSYKDAALATPVSVATSGSKHVNKNDVPRAHVLTGGLSSTSNPSLTLSSSSHGRIRTRSNADI